MLADRKKVYGITDKKTYTLKKLKHSRIYLSTSRNNFLRSKQVGKSVQLPDDEDNIIPSTSNDELFTLPMSTTPRSNKKTLLTPTYKPDFHKHHKLVEVATRSKVPPATEFALLSTFFEVSKMYY